MQSNTLVKGIKLSIASFLAIGLAGIIYYTEKPSFLNTYRPEKPSAIPNSDEYRNWTQFIIHAKIEGPEDGYSSTVVDVDTGKKYQVTSYPVGEYWDMQITKGSVQKATRVRIKLTYEQVQAMDFFPNIYDLSDTTKGRTNVPGKPYYEPYP
jgi:hypothetical protein